MGLTSAADIGGLSTERRDLGRAKRLSTLEQAIVDRPCVPVHLVDGPCHHGGVLQRLDAFGVAPAQALGQRGPRRDELFKRAFVQGVDARLECGHDQRLAD